MRSPRELNFRLRQEIANLRLFLAPPAGRSSRMPPLPRLPDPSETVEHLRGTGFAARLVELAESLLRHRFPLLGYEIETGPEIRWRRDYVHGVDSPPGYFRRIPYLDFARVGDHKIVWELNRHQHLVVLAQAFRLTGRPEFFAEIAAQLESWQQQNPYGSGINWTSALEVAFRALSWSWVYHLAGGGMAEDFRRRFLAALYLHGRYLEHNLSVYFSPNTHLLGEAVALHALGVFFPDFPRAARWRSLGSRIVEQQLDFQVGEDGTHFEQSTYYHVYALDFFLLHDVLAENTPPGWRPKLVRMAEYLHALHGAAGSLPLIGDDDGGRLFHPYGPRERFGRATLATCAVRWARPDWLASACDLEEQALWWIGPARPAPHYRPHAASRLFANAGVAVMCSGDLQLIADAGPFGPWGSGHSHSDTLSLVARLGSDEILVDAGTYTYLADTVQRNWFRGSAAHNTVRIDRTDQALPVHPFRWQGKPQVEVRSWLTGPALDFLDAVCSYNGFSHRRRVWLRKPGLVFILDDIEGPAGEHLVEQFWHFGRHPEAVSPHAFAIGSRARLLLPAGTSAVLEPRHGWRSRAYGEKSPAPCLVVARTAALPLRLAAVLDCTAQERDAVVTLESRETGVLVRLAGAADIAVLFPAHGAPVA